MSVGLSLFGSPTITSGGDSSALRFERRAQLLSFLALRRAWVGRSELAALLWPEQDARSAYANLRKTVFRMQSLPWATGMEVQDTALRFDAGTDVAEFETALRERRVADALRLRRGELLAGFDDDGNEAWTSWLNFERDRLRAAWRSAAHEYLAGELDASEGIDLAARLLDGDPLDEAALRAYMTWLARGGQGARARQAYREFVVRLADELGLMPSAELQALHDSLGAGGTAAPAAASRAPSTPQDGFVGRTVELRRITALLAQNDCRLLCVTGPGGVGKTRLAQRVLREAAPNYADGATFVPLEDIMAASELGGRLARELGVTLAGRDDPLDQVIEFLRGRETLLVLDNFEQLTNAAPSIERLLQACPRLKVLVTSRVRLSVSMEWLFTLDGLPYPDIEDQEEFETFDAVRLFVQAARRVQPALVPAAEAAAIVDICRQIEGLPLALELAAAWTRVLSCGEIAAELREGTELLRAVDAAHSSRHASLNVVFDQSWHLLSAIERDALARLSVFRGGFTAEAARTVVAAPLPVLGALADKSLLRKEGARIFMHPLVQQLAALRLGDDEAKAASERAHSLHYVRMLAQLRNEIEKGSRAALDQVDAEFENCRRAWQRAVADDEGAALMQSASSLRYFFEHRGRLEEGLALLSSAVSMKRVDANPRLAALLLGEVAQLEFRLDRYADAMATAELARSAAKSARDPSAHAQALQVLGLCALRLARHDDAKRFFRLGVQQARAGSELRRVGAMLHNLALIERLQGHQDEALRLFLESLARQRAGDEFFGEAICLGNLGLLYAGKGEFESAVAYLKEALAVCERHGLASTRVLMLANLTDVSVKMNDEAAAERYGRSALELAEAAGNRTVASHVKLNFLRLALRRGDVGEARSNLEASLRIASGIARPTLLVEAVSCFAEVLAAQGELDCARQVLAFVANHPTANSPAREEARARMAEWTADTTTDPAWPNLELEELVQRIIVESSRAYAPLIAALRAGSP